MKIEIKNVVCATDFSDFSNNAVPYAMALADKFAATIYFCHVIDLPSAAMYGEAMFDPQAIQNNVSTFASEQLTELIGDQGGNWEPMVTIGVPAEEIVRIAVDKRADLAIAATHGRSGLQRFIVGSVTERLMHTLPCPLLVIHDTAPSEAQFKKIMVGCDFSPDADLGVAYGVRLAQAFGAELHLVHIIEPHSVKDMLKPWRGPSNGDAPDLHNRLREEMLRLIPASVLPGDQPHIVLQPGLSHEELVKYAMAQNIDLIVLGVHGRGFVEKLLVGSTTDRVIRLAPCPVLSVRPKY